MKTSSSNGVGVKSILIPMILLSAILVLVAFMSFSAGLFAPVSKSTYDVYTNRVLSIEDEIENMYVTYKEGLADLHTWMVRWNEIDKDIVDICHPGMCIEESELLYLRIRVSEPENVLEIGPACGWSSLVILTALVHNKKGTLYSFDIEHKAPKILNSDPIVAAHIANRWEYRTGFVEKTYPRAFAGVGKW